MALAGCSTECDCAWLHSRGSRFICRNSSGKMQPRALLLGRRNAPSDSKALVCLFVLVERIIAPMRAPLGPSACMLLPKHWNLKSVCLGAVTILKSVVSFPHHPPRTENLRSPDMQSTETQCTFPSHLKRYVCNVETSLCMEWGMLRCPLGMHGSRDDYQSRRHFSSFLISCSFCNRHNLSPTSTGRVCCRSLRLPLQAQVCNNNIRAFSPL